MRVQRVNRGKGHSYIDRDTGEKIRSVTGILDAGVPKKALVNWSANATADWAIDHWDELSAQPISVRRKELLGARYAAKDAAARRGTQIHKLAERLVLGEKVAIPEGLEGYVEAYCAFLDEHDVQPVLVEAVVISQQHRYCGTLDLVADLADLDAEDGRSTWLLDAKTARGGIYGETALQLAAYRYCDTYLDEDEVEHDMPVVDRTGAVWVRPDGTYELVPVEAGPLQHRQFLSVAAVAEFVASGRDLIGEPIIPPTTSTYRLERQP